jgi:hypothetical protein
MDDEMLRALVDEITSCRYVSDKIAWRGGMSGACGTGPKFWASASG